MAEAACTKSMESTALLSQTSISACYHGIHPLFGFNLKIDSSPICFE